MSLSNLLPSVRLFRNNVGKVWTGIVVSSRDRQVILSNCRPFHAGLIKGSSDLIGWNTVTVSQEMVGKKIAVFTAVEIKTSKVRTTPEQVVFIENVNKAGGIAGVVYNEQDAINLIKDKIWT